MGELFEVEMQNFQQDYANGRMIERHRHLLLTLVQRGCELRGEIPTIQGKDTPDANA